MNRRYLPILILFLALLAGCSVGKGCRPDTPPPTVTPTIAPPPTIAPTMTPTAENPATATRTPIAPSVTPESATATATATIEPTVTATAVPTPAATEPVKGVHTVRRGDTLWGIACTWYADMPLLPGANPLTPCTCWPGIYWRNGALHTPQLIYPGERYGIPMECRQ